MDVKRLQHLEPDCDGEDSEIDKPYFAEINSSVNQSKCKCRISNALSMRDIVLRPE